MSLPTPLTIEAGLQAEQDLLASVCAGDSEFGLLFWQPSDRAEHLPGIAAWCEEAQLPNLRAPLELDVDGDWPVTACDAVFSANTLHIMSWASVEHFFCGAGRVLLPGAVLAVYGPFSYGGKHTAESNARFDAFLRARDPLSGVRDFDALCTLAHGHGLEFCDDHALPANNRVLIWRRSG